MICLAAFAVVCLVSLIFIFILTQRAKAALWWWELSMEDYVEWVKTGCPEDYPDRPSCS